MRIHFKFYTLDEIVIFNFIVLVQATPDAKTFCYKRVPNFYKLDLLFGKDRATGSNAAGPKERQR